MMEELFSIEEVRKTSIIRDYNDWVARCPNVLGKLVKCKIDR